MTLYNVNDVVSEIVATLDKKRIPVGAVDEILNKVREEVMWFTPVVKNGTIGLSVEEFYRQRETHEDIMKMTMTVEEAEKQLEQLPEDCLLRRAPDNFMIRVLQDKPTPAQAQAALVLAWNSILKNSELSFHQSI